MSTPPTPRPAIRHPLEVDSARLERIVDVMWATIHRVLDRPTPRRRRIGGSDILREAVNDHLTGGGVSAEDVLTDAFGALLQTPETAVTTTWEALAVGIARNKTKGALRKAGAWLHETERRPRLTVVSTDAPGRPGSDGETAGPPLELIEDPTVDLDDEFTQTSQQLELLRLAQEMLDDRDRTVFLGMHFRTRTRQSLAAEFNLTAPGVTHVYRTIAKRLYEHPRFQRYAEGGAP
jgi:DNA-directed RNA polymerase specialized sigma24 family protein